MEENIFSPPVVAKVSIPISTHYTISDAEYRVSSFTLRNKQLIFAVCMVTLSLSN